MLGSVFRQKVENSTSDLQVVEKQFSYIEVYGSR